MTQYQNGPFGYSGRNVVGYESNVDAGVMTKFFNAVYAWMAVGLALTAVVAWATADSPELRSLARNPLVLIVAFVVELGLVVAITGAINKINAATATALFMLYSAVNGFVLSVLVMRVPGASLAGAFVVTAGMFGVMSLYGFVTKRDLTRFGSLLFMALIGVVLASIVNMFWANSLLYWGITYVGVLIFVGLIAYDTQKLRHVAAQTAQSPELAARMAIVGSLVLYLDFINLFILMVRLMNNNRRD